MIEHPYARFLARVEKPGRYVGGEWGAADVSKKADLRIALAFPDSYEIGMSHIGLSVLYEIINRSETISAERVFMPWPDMESALNEHKVPLVSLESARPLCDFDIVGFSLQFELNYTNLIAMLSLGRIPRRCADRRDGDPIILVGGPAATHCEPISPFVDVCFIGDGEEALPELLSKVAQAKKMGLSRSAVVEELNRLPYAYAPGLLERISDKRSNRLVVSQADEPAARRIIVKELSGHAPGFGPVPTVEAVFDRYSLEIARGCAGGCRFCQAGFLYRPMRERSEPDVLASVERAVKELGFDSISLAALSTADCTNIDSLIRTLGELYTPERVSLSVPSLRAYGLPSEIVEVLGRLRATGVTLAPEAGSQRLRDVINKNVTENDLFDAVSRFFDWGFTKIKLYFMLGLPTETDDDLVQIVDLARRLVIFGRKRLRGRPPAVTVSVSTFIPKPHTPFEREGMIGFAEITAKQELIASLCKKERIEARFHSPRLSVLEGALCRGDIGLADVLEKAVDMGARFDGWEDMFNQPVWDSLFSKMNVADLLGPIPDDARTPWDHLDIGVKTAFLRKERDRAREEKTTQPCGRFMREKESENSVEFVCHGCGLSCKSAGLPVHRPVDRRKAEGFENEPQPQRTAMRPRPIDDNVGADSVRVRLFFAKWGRQAFVGHLDTMRHIVSSLRRAGLKLSYTQGFHPKPKMQSAPPLPLGLAGLKEPLDVYLIDPPGENEILERLKGRTPADLEFVGAVKIDTGDKSLAKRITAASYVALVKANSDTIRSGIEKLLGAQSFVVERKQKGQVKQEDIRPFIIDAKPAQVRPDDLHLPLDEERVAVAFTLATPGSGGAKPKEILEAIVGSSDFDAWIVRTELKLT